MTNDTPPLPEAGPAPDDGFVRRSFIAAVAFTAVVATLAVALPASAQAGPTLPSHHQVQAGTAA